MKPGDVLAGRFELEREAGAGGMSTVFRARDRESGATVAVKVLHGRSAVDTERFAREALTLAEVSHPGIVRYVASGTDTGGEHFLALEWLDGEDLSQRLARAGLTVTEALTVARRAAAALAVAHARGIVHRDVKPSNMFLPHGNVAELKLLDFGIARRGRGEARGVTRTGVLVGTPEYMAPEQARGGRDIDARVDVFALGCVLFECIAGRPAFLGDTFVAVLAKILLEEPPRLREARPDAPAALDALVAQMLAKEPRERPADGAAVLAALDALGPLEDGPDAVAPAAPRPFTEALTSHEQRLVSLVLAGCSPSSAHTVTHTPTLVLDDTSAAESAGGAVPLLAMAAAHGARLEVLADGSVLAVLAGEGAATDLAVRAARCALALRPALPRAPMVLATGRAVVGARAPVGESIDRAARALAEAAPGGPVRLDEATAALIDARFDVGGDAGGLYLRGERDAVEGVRTLLGRPTPCVGRERELAILEATWDECVTESIARVVLVTAPAGAGKSRLLQEFRRRLGARDDSAGASVLVGAADPLGAGAAFALLGAALERAAGIADGEAPEVKRARVRARIARHVPAAEQPRVAAFLGELARAPFPDDAHPALAAARDDAVLMGDSMRAAWETFLAAECEAGPVLLVLEDLHWGDLPSVSFVDSVLRNLREQRLMVLALARPDVRARFPDLWPAHELQDVRLGALTRRAAERLVRGALGDTVDESTVSRIVERGEGNAFYLEELVRAAAAGRGAAELPSGVLGMVQMRLVALEPEARRLLRAASVFGQSFWRGGVMRLLGAEHKTAGVLEWIEELVAREIVVRSPDAAVPGETEYTFRHALVRDAAYAMLTDEDRTRGHRLAGEWLEAAGAATAAALAEHYDLGGEPVRAAECYRRAAEQALEGNDLVAALERAARGAALGAAGATADTMAALALVQAEAHNWRGEADAAATRAADALALVPVGTEHWFRAMSEAVAAASKIARPGELEARAAELLAADPAPDAVGAQLFALTRTTTQFLQLGRMGLLPKIAARAQVLAPDTTALPPPLRPVVFMLRALLDSARTSTQPPNAALGALENAVAAFEQIGDARNGSLLRNNLGHVRGLLGDYAGAEAMLRRSVAEAERLGLTYVAALALHNLGNVRARRGALDEARALEARAIESFERQGNARLAGAARIYLAQALFAAGDFAGAVREADLSLARMPEGAPNLLIDAHAVRSRALTAAGDASAGLAAARAAMQLLPALGGGAVPRMGAWLAYAEALFAAGDTAAAREALASACAQALAVADRIEDRAVRERALGQVTEHVQLFALARAWGVVVPGAPER